MASGFWVVSMTEQARLVSAFVTPFGLFEWMRMPIGLTNIPQIYQLLLHNALRFFEDFAIYTSILYELREVDFHEMDQKPHRTAGDEKQIPSADEANKWARVALELLKNKIADAPMLRHFGPDRPPVIVVYTSDWAISATLMQEHDGTLKSNELTYETVEKVILALLRILDVCYTTLVTRSINVLTRYSTLAWLVRSSGLQSRLSNWAALLSPWTLEIFKCTRGEDEILGIIAASITSRENVDSILSSIAPRKQPRSHVAATPPTVDQGEGLLVVRFDGSNRVKRGGEVCSAIV
ncbi:hypothetical protein PInf_005463 [Phytophthora infestans]|nr:hypothetical protein PInf_005463 [Phytophthora infestans]